MIVTVITIKSSSMFYIYHTDIAKATDPNTHVINPLGDNSSLILQRVNFAGKGVVVIRGIQGL